MTDRIGFEVVIAMAVAAIAEENKVSPKRVTVSSFKEIEKSSLEQYIEDQHIAYAKYQLEGVSR